MRDLSDSTPLFQTPPGEGDRRLLLVSYHFPPSELVGALRWEQMLRYLFARGWTADVITVPFASPSAAERDRLAAIGPGLRVYGVAPSRTVLEVVREWRAARSNVAARRFSDAASEIGTDEGASTQPSRLRGILSDLKGGVLARDYYRKWNYWARDVARLGVRLGRSTHYDVVASSGPPHMVHEAARRIASRLRVPLMLDYRDTWTSSDALLPSFHAATWFSLSDRYERRCVETASRIVMNTPSAAKFMQRKYPAAVDRTIVVMNGADGRVPDTLVHLPRFIIGYAGALYGGRRVRSLFSATRRVIERCAATPEELHLHFMGVEPEQRTALRALADTERIAAYFECDTRRPRREALALLDSSSVLVLLPQVFTMAVPAKLFEYVQRPAWLLALTEPGTATFEVLQGTGADLIDPDDVGGIANVLAEHLLAWRSGTVPVPANRDGRFSRERQSERILAELNAIAPGNRAG